MGVILPRVHSASSSCREVVAEPEGSVAVQSSELKLGGRREWGWGGGYGWRAALMCTHRCTHTGTWTRALHAHLHACMYLLHMHGCTCAQYTCTSTHTCAHHAHAQLRAVLSPPGDSKPPRPHAREAPALGCTHARSQPRAPECTHGDTRGCAQPRTPPAHDPARRQTRRADVGEEERWEETQRGGTGRAVGVTGGCRASRVGMLTLRGRRWSRRGAAAGGAARSGCGPRSLRSR